ncbi:hypothetical protein K2173_021754 [Erythroxylum novogranatense]|uniref:Dirigent protein n=1 Tax=Erythroxylum novogranatense TaxID=1862640 RepID=A0AAV8TXR7_9ROSI|nr:hypothetical protein K2173_021754 [Erythroxylum novogranatense]
MAKLLSLVASQLTISILFSSFFSTQILAENNGYEKAIDPKLFALKEQKLTHFHFFIHHTYSGSNPSVIQIVPTPPTNISAYTFGSMSMVDDPLTEGPNLSSKLIGKAQGFDGSSAQEETSLIVAINIVFTEEKYNGSTITLLGREQLSSKVREFPVIGGSKIFRFAQGYAQTRSYFINSTSGDAIAECDIYVLHY